MMIKIISKKNYDELVGLLKDACELIISLKAENDALKEAMRTKTTYVDFPATKKLHEDKIH